jgi:diguanylate cyclase (GGDEF)-like protein
MNHRQKVLVIDDSDLIHNLVRARLADQPVVVHSAATAADGLAMAASLAPDLILLDVDMPGCDGFEACRRLKSDAATTAIPVIFLTGAGDPEQKVRGLELGAVDYVTKPFDPSELRARVRAALRTKYLMDLLAQRAMIDGLTGLWNRACFEQRLQTELALAARTARPLACALIDLDHFKLVNDTYGHPFGDEVLRTVAQVVVDACRTEDVVCRYGGEELVLLLPNTTAAHALELADRVRLAVSQTPFRTLQGSLKVTCSIGVADSLDGRAAAMVELADRALYRAKQSGRDQAVDACHPAFTAAA